MSIARISFVLMLAVSAAAGGCRRAPNQAAPAGDTLLRVAGEELRIPEVQWQLDHMSPPARARYSDPAQREELLEGILDSEILAGEAQRLGYDRDPEVVSAARVAAKKVMVSKLLKQRIGEPAPRHEPSEAAIADYYRAHPEHFGHAEELRLADAIVPTRDVALRLLEEAREAAARAAHASGGGPGSAADIDGFRELVTRYSKEQAARPLRGEFTLVAGEPDGARPRALVEAAFALRAPGELSAPIEAPDGVHVLKLIQRMPAWRRSLDESKGKIARMLGDDARDQAVREVVASLRQSVKVEVFRDRLSQLRFDAGGSTPPPPPFQARLASSAPAIATGGRGPGLSDR